MVYVAGAYQSKFGELWDRGLEELIFEAGKGAVEDARIEPEGVEAVYVGSMLGAWVSGQNHLGGVVAETLGVSCPVTVVEAACASGGVAVREAAEMVRLGRYKRVLVIGVEKMSDVGGGVVAEALMGAADFRERESGATFAGLYGLMARAYMGEFGLGRAQLSRVAVESHKWGSTNELAQFRFEVSEGQVSRSAMVASPLRLLDCSGISDGAAALVLTGERVKRGVKILGSGQASAGLGLARRESLAGIEATGWAGKRAAEAAGVELLEVEVAEVHDCFSIAGLWR